MTHVEPRYSRLLLAIVIGGAVLALGSLVWTGVSAGRSQDAAEENRRATRALAGALASEQANSRANGVTPVAPAPSAIVREAGAGAVGQPGQTGKGIVAVVLVAGRLIVTYTDGTQSDAGAVPVASPSAPASPSPGRDGTDGPSGQNGADGQNGRDGDAGRPPSAIRINGQVCTPDQPPDPGSAPTYTCRPDDPSPSPTPEPTVDTTTPSSDSGGPPPAGALLGLLGAMSALAGVYPPHGSRVHIPSIPLEAP